MIEGSGFVSMTNGSVSGRPKNIWILGIRIGNTELRGPRYWCQCTFGAQLFRGASLWGVVTPPPPPTTTTTFRYFFLFESLIMSWSPSPNLSISVGYYVKPARQRVRALFQVTVFSDPGSFLGLEFPQFWVFSGSEYFSHKGSFSRSEHSLPGTGTI
jgi:hypothetical protein